MISKITIGELERFNELGFKINNNFSNVFDLNKIIDSQYDDVYGYYVSGKLIAFIHVTKLYETMDIVNIIVDEAYRKRGIATKLINYVIGLFDDIDNVMLEVNENNKAAISLYEKNKFEIINKRNNYYGSDAALIMKRVVDNEKC